MDKKRLDYYKKKLVTRREELVRGIARTEQEGPKPMRIRRWI